MRRRRPLLTMLTIAVTLLGLGIVQAPAQAAPAFRALVFSETAGYRHDSIAAGVTMFNQLATANNFEVVFSEDSTVFNTANLNTYDVLVMFQTSGMVFDNDAQRTAVQ
ncbi:MAG TPA: ThuA domain-containing protein, partial [Asanoa sp.]|nr:ThuA domain-containing protein [Asanoa sp.]